MLLYINYSDLESEDKGQPTFKEVVDKLFDASYVKQFVRDSTLLSIVLELTRGDSERQLSYDLTIKFGPDDDC